MFTIAGILIRLLEGLAITAAIYLIAKKSLDYREIFTLVLTISVTFMILDLFAPNVAIGARQGSGFGLGFSQVAGYTGMPRRYYNPKTGKIIEGMDDRVALQYYGQYNPGATEEHPKVEGEPNIVVSAPENQAQVPSIILEQYSKNPFTTNEMVNSQLAPYPN